MTAAYLPGLWSESTNRFQFKYKSVITVRWLRLESFLGRFTAGSLCGWLPLGTSRLISIYFYYLLTSLLTAQVLIHQYPRRYLNTHQAVTFAKGAYGSAEDAEIKPSLLCKVSSLFRVNHWIKSWWSPFMSGNLATISIFAFQKGPMVSSGHWIPFAKALYFKLGRALDPPLQVCSCLDERELREKYLEKSWWCIVYSQTSRPCFEPLV